MRNSSPRETRIEELELLGLDASRFKAMTDQEYESHVNFHMEKLLRREADYPKKGNKGWL